MTMRSKVTFHYLGTEPADANPCWDEDAQGVTHDDEFWYFTRQHLLVKMSVTRSVARDSAEGSTGIPGALWNYHETHGLGESLDDHVGAGQKILRARYDHFGDVDYFAGFLLIAMTGTATWRDWQDDEQRAGMPPILAVFRAADLSLVGWEVLTEQRGAGWCAVNPKDGLLYTSDKHIKDDSPIKAYYIAWDALRSGADRFLEFEKDVRLQLPYALEHMQGGCFGPQRYLFLTNGYGTDFNVDRGGIHVFDMDDDGRLVESSSQSGEGLRFQFDPALITSEEPEGITWWDLDDSRAPRILGQLHAIMLDNDLLSSDDIYFKHYRVKDVVERASYLTHTVRQDLALPGEGSQVIRSPRDLMVSEHHRILLHDGMVTRVPRDQSLAAALASGDRVARLDLSATLTGVGLDSSRTAIGLTEVDGHMWIPLAGGDPAVLVLRDDFQTVGIWTPPDRGDVAWVAINPRTRELYAGASETSVVRRYAVDWDRIHRSSELRSSHIGDLPLIDPIGRLRVVSGARAACVAPDGHVFYVSEPRGISVFAVRGGRVVDATHDAMLEEGKGPSFEGRPAAGERICGIAVWRDDDGLVAETLLQQADGSIRWLQLIGQPNEGSLGVGFIGNRRSKEVHKRHCVWVGKMNEENKVFFNSPLKAAEDGYDGCGTCLRYYNTG